MGSASTNSIRRATRPLCETSNCEGPARHEYPRRAGEAERQPGGPCRFGRDTDAERVPERAHRGGDSKRHRPPRPGAKKKHLAKWLAGIESDYGERVLPLDAETARIWGELTARAQKKGVIIPPSDGLLAATGLRHGLHATTRNTKHFEASGAIVIDPCSSDVDITSPVTEHEVFAEVHPTFPPDPMPTPSVKSLRRFRHWMKVLAVLMLGLTISSGPAMGSSWRSAPSEADENGEPHSCCCGPRCSGVSCCCGPKKPLKRETTPASSSSTDSGPCLGAAPCGDPAVPSAAFVGPSAKAATLLRHLVLPGHRTSGRLTSAPSGLRFPARLASRLERPPKGLAPA